jgi:hypothetical protein
VFLCKRVLSMIFTACSKAVYFIVRSTRSGCVHTQVSRSVHIRAVSSTCDGCCIQCNPCCARLAETQQGDGLYYTVEVFHVVKYVQPQQVRIQDIGRIISLKSRNVQSG